MPRYLLFALGALLLTSPLLQAQDKPRIPIILDTDLGSEIDDAYALALAVASPEIELVGVTTVTGDTEIRAKMACRFLHAAGKEKVPVACGAQPQPKSEITGQYQYYYHPAQIYGRTGKPVKESAVEFMYQTLKKRPGEITIVAIGPLTNVARLLKEHPDARPWIKRIVVMGGAIDADYEGNKKPVAEWNIKMDIPAAQAVFAAEVPLTVVPLDATWNLKLDDERRQKIFDKHSMLTMQVEAMHQMWNKDAPVLFDALAVALCVDEKLSDGDPVMPIEITESGHTKVPETGTMHRVFLETAADKFLDWYVERLTSHGKSSLPRALKNRTDLITDDKFPARVHAFEDFETDIEKRWWLAGRLEEKDVPAGSKRAFKSFLTLDFDDLQGQLDTMYNAVAFNPVPGPPMGERTRLKFRYKLHGTDELRVQIYSLSNGYHRYLSLAGLKRDEWQSATVDMTAARRPDGSGGPLSKDERIDDIQFYVDPRASVLIDDIILYDGADKDEKRPFPKRILFTGWFDTGKQGNEWPGKFEIVPHEKPRTWKYAKSVRLVKEAPLQGIIVGLRGERTPRKEHKLSVAFNYRIVGAAETLHVMTGTDGEVSVPVVVKRDMADKWVSANVTFGRDQQPLEKFNQLHFVLDNEESTLSLDDVLLYEE